MRILLATVLFLLSGYGEQKPLLQVTVDGWGVVWPQGKQNYITVWPDGTVNYLIKAKRGLPAQVTDAINRRRLEEVTQAVEQLAKSGNGKVQVESPVDYRLTVHIETAQGSSVEISHYDFDNPKAVSPEVYRLLCVVDSIRDEPYRLTKESLCK